MFGIGYTDRQHELCLFYTCVRPRIHVHLGVVKDINTLPSAPLPGSSHFISNAVIIAKRIARGFEHPVRIEYGLWRRGNPFYDWAQRRSNAKLEAMQLRKEQKEPFFHEYVTFRLSDGKCFRIDRRQIPDEGSPMDCTSDQGVEAYDTIEQITSLEDSDSIYNPSDCLAQIRFTTGADLNLIVGICRRLSIDGPALNEFARVYTVQRYNCYFYAQTVLLCAVLGPPPPSARVCFRCMYVNSSLVTAFKQEAVLVLKGVDGTLYHAQQVVDQLIQPNAMITRYDICRLDQSSNSVIRAMPSLETSGVMDALRQAHQFICAEEGRGKLCASNKWLIQIVSQALKTDLSYDGWGPSPEIQHRYKLIYSPPTGSVVDNLMWKPPQGSKTSEESSSTTSHIMRWSSGSTELQNFTPRTLAANPETFRQSSESVSEGLNQGCDPSKEPHEKLHSLQTVNDMETTAYLNQELQERVQLSDTICPCSISISGFVQRSQRETKSAEEASEQTKHIAVEALAWLIKTSEDPKSTDIALQAFVGADPNNVTADRQVLKESEADTMISRQLIGLDSYSSSYKETPDLYTRAQTLLQPSSLAPVQPKVVPTSSGEKGVDSPSQEVQNGSSVGFQKGLNRELHRKIRDLRDKLNQEITAYVTSSEHDFISTPNNILALLRGSTAASHCLRSLQHGIQLQTQELFDSALELLENYRNGTAYLKTREIHYLMTGIAMLLSSLLVECPPAIGARYVMRLLRIAGRPENGQKALRLENLGLPLVVYALSRHDYPGWTQPPPLSPVSRAERAIEVITHYVGSSENLSTASSIMINLALLELISNPVEYKLEDTDIVAISEAFDSMVDDDQTRTIHTLSTSSPPDSFSRTVRSMDAVVSNEGSGLLARDAVTIACLTVLNRTGMDQSATDAPLGEVYTFVIDCMSNLPPYIYGRWAYDQNAALDLLQKFHDPSHPERTQNLLPNLARSLDRREIFTKLKEATELEATSDDVDFAAKLFATGQAWLLIDLAIKSGSTKHEDWRRCLSSFVGDEGLWDSTDLGISRLEGWRSTLAERYKGMWEWDPMPRHPYFRILLHSISAGTGSGDGNQ
ncbi:hypothetical protein RSAG8_10164, partial [Rhizoctonia solani AG-8 WAC10335]